MRRLANILICMACALCGALAPAEAAQDTAATDTVNVTAKRYQAEELDTGSFTTVLTAEDIAQRGGENAFEILQRTGGVDFSASFPGGVNQGGMNGEIGIRGISGGELMLLNGVSVIEPSTESYDLDQFPAAFLERVEMVKGANAVLYGSRAMTGVVNMRTRQPGDPAVGGALTGGSNAFAEANAWYRNPYVFLGVNYSRQDDLENAKKNYSNSSPYNTDLLAPNKYATLFSARPWEPLTFNYMFAYTDTGYRADYYKKPLSSYEVDEAIYHHYVSATYEKNQLKATVFLNFHHLDFEYDYYNDKAKPKREVDKNSYVTGLDLQHSTTAWDTMFLYGGTYTYELQDETREDIAGSASSGYYLTRQQLDNTRHLPSVFLQGEHSFMDRLILTVGIRGQGVFNTAEGSDDYFEPVPAVQGVFKLNDQHSLFANVGRAFRVPTFNQLFIDTDTLQGSPDLEPEYGWTYEAGWKFEQGPFSGTLSGFLMQFTDKIRYIRESDGKFHAHNVDEFQTAGVEWNLGLKVLDHFKLTLGGYGADPWQKEDGVKEQAGSKWQVAPGVFFENGPLQLGLNASMLMERETELDDYVNLHLTGSYQLTDWLKLKVKADNLLDQDLVVTGDMTPGYSSQYEVFDSGVWFYAGIEIDLNLL